MKKLFVILILLLIIPMQTSALEITAPEVPISGKDLMPRQTENFSDGLRTILKDALSLLRPDLMEAMQSCLGVIATVMLLSIVQSCSPKMKMESNLVGAVAVGVIFLQSSQSLLSLASETISELSEYGKLLLPVMTSALAAQGAVNASAALYTATALFNAFLTSVLKKLMIPMVYIFLALAIANSALGNDTLKRMRDMLKGTMTWLLKILMSAFTGYLGLTGVISGTTDTMALKATKMTISGMVPIVGGILSDASETVLVSAGLVKNAAGIYGILALLAVFASPFLKIGIHYLLLKLTSCVCGIFGIKGAGDLIGDFAGAMGLLLGMTAAICLLLMVSTVCFLRGIST